MSTIQSISAKLQFILASIPGIVRVFEDVPELSPDAADCPCIVMGWQKPSWTANGSFGQLIDYTWHYEIRLLLKPITLGKVEENLAEVKEFVEPFVEALCAHLTGDGAWDNWNKDNGTLSGTIGIVPQGDEQFWGWVCPLDINKGVETPMSA